MLLPNEHNNGTETFSHRLADAYTHTRSRTSIQSKCLAEKRKITKRNDTQWHHSDLSSALALSSLLSQDRMVFGFLRYRIVSYRITLYKIFRLTFFVEDVGFLYSSTLLIANALLFIFPFWFSASHGPLLMNNYYSKYLAYIVHLHSLFNYAIRILINPNSFFFLSFVVAVGHRPKNGVASVYCAQHHSSRKKEHKKYGWNESNEIFNDFAHKHFNSCVINWISIELFKCADTFCALSIAGIEIEIIECYMHTWWTKDREKQSFCIPLFHHPIELSRFSDLYSNTPRTPDNQQKTLNRN